MAENFDNLFYLPSNDASILPDSSTVVDDSNKTDSVLIETAEINDYKPLSYHWFYTDYALDKLVWMPMSYKDSSTLEKTFVDNKDEIKKLRKSELLERKLNSKYVVCVKGGRFEVDLVTLEKRPLYWETKKKSQIRRCLWFYKENDDLKFQPYHEEYSEFLEIEYEKTLKTKSFHKRIDFVSKESQLQNEEVFVFHSPSIMLHFTQAELMDEFSNISSDAKRPRVIKRGIDELVEKIEEDEIQNIDHVCFVIHGIGEGCDMKFRPLVDCVDDFREIGSYIIDSHLKSYVETHKLNGRVEFLPISWHEELHEQTGVDERLDPITLSSIPKLRQFSNSTILDVLFYTSPIYCQTIISKVGNELNRLTKLFKEKNPYFNGKISLVGHSLGSLIVYDLLTHQSDDEFSREEKEEVQVKKQKLNETLDDLLSRLNLIEHKSLFEKEKITIESLSLLTETDLIALGLPMGPRKIIYDEIKNNLFKKDRDEIKKRIKANLKRINTETSEDDVEFKCSYGTAGTGQLLIKYPKLDFKVSNFFALGSPIGMFLTVRGQDLVGTEYKFPNCDKFFNIFHPFDPVAYRFEPLVNPKTILKPVLMPHHKGRKRMHLELMGLSKVGIDLKEKMVGQLKSAWNSFNIAKIGSNPTSSSSMIEQVTVQSQTVKIEVTEKTNETKIEENQKLTEQAEIEENVNFGKINQGRRIDYVLQESPIESFNEYLFALASHACYWESEDTLLLIIKEMYDQGYTVDSNTELLLSDQQQKSASWLTQAAASAISTNVQKTFSYFNMSVPQNISSFLASNITSTITRPISSLNTATTTSTKNPNPDK